MITEQRHSRASGVIASSRQSMLEYVVSRLLLLTLPLVLLLTASDSATAQQADDLDGTIQYLIAYVRDSGVKFERNFGSHNSFEAASHIEKKYQHFRDEIDTPEKFIELSATASLVTGKEYRVITEQGEEIPAGEWLNDELKRYRLQSKE